MANFLKSERLNKVARIFIFSWLVCLVTILNSFSMGMNHPVYTTEIEWKKECEAIIDGRVVDCAYSGGMEFCKPTFVDIDADGDLDMFVGGENGRISSFRNDGTKNQPRWSFISDYYDSIEVGGKSAPAFADINGDGDFDLFIGNEEGKIIFYQNDGSSTFPLWIRISDNYASMDVGERSIPAVVDIDADLDLDLFIGGKGGNINFYRNDGTKQNPIWTRGTANYDSIDVGAGSAPYFVDIDDDGDFDLFLGEENGNVNFYRNIGTSTSPGWDSVTSDYNSIGVGRHSVPAFVDIDNDSDFDLFIGQEEGKIYFYRNDGNPWLPNWSFVAENYHFMDSGSYTKPALADIDDDGDFDLFIGEKEGNIDFYRDEASWPIPSWTLVTENYYAIEAGDFSQPTFADIDADGDLDLFIGRSDGRIEFYRNVGSSHSSSWVLVSDNYNGIDVSGYASPTFVDIDADSDLDLFIGQIYGKIFFYRNDGTPHNPFWTLVSDSWNSFDVGYYCVPTFADLDLDGGFDLLVGNGEGRIFFYRNDGTPQTDSFVFITDYYDSIDVGDRSAPVLCDVDSDGDPDLFIGEAEGGLHFYRNPTLNSIRGEVTDEENIPLAEVIVYLSGHKTDTTFTDSLGNYQFIGLPVGNYCVFRNPGSFQYCFTPLDSDAFGINFTGITSVDEGVDTFNLSPKTYGLSQNYPNPFNPTTTIPFHLQGQGSRLGGQSQANATLKIYNIRGELVRTLLDEPKEKGKYETIWDGKDEYGNQVASGIYFYQLRIKDFCDTKKMILVK
jgi:hypothetical protein